MDVTWYELVPKHRNYISKIAGRMVRGLDSPGTTNSIDVKDLIQIGSMAALEYAPAYDPARGPFKDYIQKRVAGAMIDVLRQQGSDERNSGGYRFFLSIEDEVTEEFASHWTGKRGVLWKDHLPCVKGDALRDWESRRDLDVAIGTLPERLQTVMRWRLADMEQPEIGKRLGVSAARVCMLEKEALRLLRRHFGVLAPPDVRRPDRTMRRLVSRISKGSGQAYTTIQAGLDDAVMGLSPRLAQVIHCRLEGMSQVATGRHLGISRDRGNADYATAVQHLTKYFSRMDSRGRITAGDTT